MMLLERVSETTWEGPFGQAKEISTDNETAFKTYDGMTRYLANNGGAFAENILRTVFGYEPLWLEHDVRRVPALSNWSRGVRGTLHCVRGPGGHQYGTAVLDDDVGVVFEWGPHCD